MTAPVITIGPDTPVRDVAELLLARGISAVPVVDAERRLLGIVSEGDLMRRPETGTQRKRSWWLALFAGGDADARAYVKSHGQRAEQIMTRDVATVEETTELNEIAELLERRGIKRVPVMRAGEVVGIVSRANLLQAFASSPRAAPVSLDDRALRERVLGELKRSGIEAPFINVVVQDGSVALWGGVRSNDQRDALVTAAEAGAGRAVRNNLAVFSPAVQSVMWGE
jgi:CBS domain-containing protein